MMKAATEKLSADLVNNKLHAKIVQENVMKAAQQPEPEPQPQQPPVVEKVIPPPAAATPTPDEIIAAAFSQQPAQQPEPAAEAKPALTLVDYSEKAFAIIGDTKPIKETLKTLGGRYNPGLKCGAGWIFSKKRTDAVKQALSL